MQKRRDKLAGFLIVFFIVFAGYFYTLAPTVSFWDCGEFIACSYILGVPHPPGTPLVVLVGRIFTLLPIFSEIARRVNLASALSGSLAAGFLYLIVVKLWERWRGSPSFLHHLAAGACAIAGAFSFSVWDSSVEAEVYSPSNFLVVFILWLGLLWEDNLKKHGSKNILFLILYLVFLSIGVHLLPFLAFPGLLIYILIVDHEIHRDKKLVYLFLALSGGALFFMIILKAAANVQILPLMLLLSGLVYTVIINFRDFGREKPPVITRNISLCILLIFIAVSTYAYLMIRAHLDPDINEAEPTTFKALWAVFNREQYGPMQLFPRRTSIETGLSLIPAFWEQIKIYLKYFSWQYVPFPREDVNTVLRFLSVIGTYLYVFLGIFGMWVHYREDKKTFWYLFITYLLTGLGLVVYLNLKFSPSDPNPAHKPREVRERDYFFLTSFFLFALYIGHALAYLAEKAKEKWERKEALYPVYAGMVILAFLPFISNIKSHVNRRGNWMAHDVGYNMLSTCRENSILFTNGDNDTFPLWFYQFVKRYRLFDAEEKKGVIVANLSLLNTSWYIKQLKRRGVPMDFASTFENTVYRRKWEEARMTGKTDKDFEEWVIDHLYPTRSLDGKILYVKDMAIRNIIATACGRKLPFEDMIAPVDSFVKKYIESGFNPSVNIYFAVTVSKDNRQGYEEHFVLEGLAYRLVEEKGKNMIDFARTESLLYNFRYTSIFDPNVYKDDNARRIISNYGAVFFTLGNGYRRKVIPERNYFLMYTRDLKLNLTPEERKYLEKAKKAYLMGMRFLSGDIAPFVIELKGVLCLLGEYDEAEKILKETIATTKNPEELAFYYSLLGDVYYDKGDIQKSKQAYTNTLEINPKEENALAGLLEIAWYKEKNETAARKFLRKLMKNPEIFAKVMRYCNFRQKKDLLIAGIEEWLKEHPDDKEARRMLDSLRRM